jgi:digeranylgeranylglycerophospholipid reductase
VVFLKVAIIGAGTAGLACAHELERHGITPTVYEQKSSIGDVKNHVIATLEIIDRPIKDWVSYVKNEFDLNINPLNSINTLTHHSPNKTTTIKGNLGYFIKRNADKDSFLSQLYSQLNKAEVIFNLEADYKQLSKENDFVVVSNGYVDVTKELGCWKERISGWIRVATVSGNFNPEELIIWLNKNYTGKGYAYLTPYSNKEASMCLFIPYINKGELNQYWETFISTEKIKYTIEAQYDIAHHSGFVYPHKINNIYLAGITGGSVSPLLGFGKVKSVLQGIYAAQSIAEGTSYEKLLKNIVQKTDDMWKLRKVYNKATNKNYDEILSLIGLPISRQLIYKTPLNIIKLGAKTIRLKNKVMNNNQSNRD